MDFSYPEEYSSEEADRSSEQNDDTGTGRSYECVFCKRGFTTAQALGGHMNIHRKDRANKTKPNFPVSSSSKVVDDNLNNYADLGFYSAIPSHLTGGNYYSTSPNEVYANYNNYPQIYFPAPACGIKPSHVLRNEVLCEESQRDHRHLFGQDWRSLYGNPLCVGEHKDKVEDSSEEDGLDLELRLGHHP